MLANSRCAARSTPRWGPQTAANHNQIAKTCNSQTALVSLFRRFRQGLGVLPSWTLRVRVASPAVQVRRRVEVRMSPSEVHRRFIAFDPEKGFPFGPSLFYICLQCGETLPSLPADAEHCRCRNIMIDSGRLSVQDESKMRLFEKDTPP